MKTSTIKLFGLLIILVISTFQMNAIVDKKLGKVNTSSVLRLADVAFRDMKYSIAADYYQSYLTDNTKVTKKVLLKLAECYWQMHKFSTTLEVYLRAFPAGKEEASIIERRRVAELYARNGQYQKAAEWLNGIIGYESKALLYSNQYN